ncbi:MAG: hypothetical protein FJX74_22585 [Armatimonadetes bacterium]|nr:hypothetical protein [Armatimonadota bacterium]
MSLRKIRVGMVGCDLHALYYGVQMERHDPSVLRSLGRGQAAFFYHYLNYNDATRLTSPFVSGFTLAKVWDPDPHAAETASTIFGGKPQVCETFVECSDDVDLVFIPDCNGDGSGHLELATPGLRKRVPTFVDKPLADNLKAARAIVALARRQRTPLLSLSMLRTVPQAARFRDRLQEIAPVGFGSIKGPGGTLAGSIHTISLAQHVFGPGVQAVDCMGPSELAYLHLDYGGRLDRPTAGLMLNCESGPTYHCSLYVSAFSAQGAIHSGQIGDFEFPWGAAEILRLLKRMVRTGRSPFSDEEMLEPLAIADAGRLAQQTGRRVALSEAG